MNKVLITNLISHEINCEELLNNISPNVLKDEGLEWNEVLHQEHRFSKEIIDSDLVIAIENIDAPHEEYAYFFFKVATSIEGNKAYIFNKVILEENLTDDFIRYCIGMVLQNLVNMDDLTTDRIILKENYPLSKVHINTTKRKVADEILQRFQLAKTGMAADEDISKLLRFGNDSFPEL